MDGKTKSPCQVHQRVKYTFNLVLAQGDHLRDHRAVKEELNLVKLVTFCGVLVDDGEQVGLVSQVITPQGTHSLPGWLEVRALSKDVDKGARCRVKSTCW